MRLITFQNNTDTNDVLNHFKKILVYVRTFKLKKMPPLYAPLILKLFLLKCRDRLCVVFFLEQTCDIYPVFTVLILTALGKNEMYLAENHLLKKKRKQ